MKWPRLSLTWQSKLVILTGAGISAESGIKTFRDNNGLWENHDVMEVATPEGFARKPELVYRFYNQRRAQLLDPNVAPNEAHLAIARLQKQWQGEVIIVTQNVDNLHERAGSNSIFHMHGELLKMRCQKTQQIFESPLILDSQTMCACCHERGNLRPHIVWFGEVPLQMELISKHIHECELFISIGTSGVVYPAALMVNWARENGAQTVEINLEASARSSHFHHTYHDRAAHLTPLFVSELLRQASLPSL